MDLDKARTESATQLMEEKQTLLARIEELTDLARKADANLTKLRNVLSQVDNYFHGCHAEPLYLGVKVSKVLDETK